MVDYRILLFVYVFFSLLTFCVYGIDKAAAKRDTWRVKESRLHFLSLCGGWIGAIIGQKVFRHKTKKLRFRIVFWLTVILNLIFSIGFVSLFNFSFLFPS